MSHRLHQDAKNIGARFRSARSLVLDLNRKSFCERHGINRYTMQSWENGLHVSKGKNVERFIEALAREGVYCTSEWLIEGIGEPAKPLFNATTSIDVRSDHPQNQSEQSLNHIIDSLTRAHSELDEQLLSFHIPDDAMAPKFLAGDLVFGRLLMGEEKKNVHQKYCIIELGPGRLIVRKVINTKEGFLLLALDERLQSFGLNLSSDLYLIVWHLMAQSRALPR